MTMMDGRYTVYRWGQKGKGLVTSQLHKPPFSTSV